MLDSGLQDQGADGLPRHLHEDTRGGDVDSRLRGTDGEGRCKLISY